jgi:hypothetical protein
MLARQVSSFMPIHAIKIREMDGKQFNELKTERFLQH